MSKSEFYIRPIFGASIMKRSTHWWQSDHRVRYDFPGTPRSLPLVQCYLLNHCCLPDVYDYIIEPCPLEQHCPTDPKYSYKVCAVYLIPHGESEGTELLTPSAVPPREGDGPVRLLPEDREQR